MIIKDALKPCYHYLKYGVPLGYIFMLHRVEEKNPDGIQANENMKVSPEFLDDFLKKYKQEYDYISLEAIPGRLINPTSKRFMAFTMDDGYLDNLTNAYPIFKKYNVPYTIFLATDFAEKKAILWWYVLEDIVLESDTVILSKDRWFNCETKEQKEQTFLQIRDIILGLNQNNLQHELDELFQMKIDWNEKVNKLALSWDDVNKYKDDLIVSIGGHTKSHCNLKSLNTVPEVEREITEGIDIIRRNTGLNAKLFAYPYGSANEVGSREVTAASECGLDMAFLAYGGYCSRKHMNSLFALPRIMLTESFSEKQLV